MKVYEPAMIPRPKRYERRGADCRLRQPVRFHLPEGGELAECSVRLALADRLELERMPSHNPPEQGLNLKIGDPQIDDPSPEAYRLTILGQSITITSRGGDGLLMGLRTLAQLVHDGRAPQCQIVDWPDMSLRAAHICYHLIRETLAYNVPNFDALIEHIDRLAALKYNAVLLELESMFPYQKHATISCRQAFSVEQIRNLRGRLKDQRMQIIPLVQCLGHAYNVLIHDEYSEYREMPGTYQQYCPTHPRLVDLYMQFVEEYLTVFDDVRQWHVGGDESRQLGQCPRCKAKVEEHGVSKLYCDHVVSVLEKVHQRGLTPLLWHDIIERHPESAAQLPPYAKLVYWNYDPALWRSWSDSLSLVKKLGMAFIGATGIRWAGWGTELSVYYPYTLRALETLIPMIYREGSREIIVTNWMKGSPHENTDYGFAWAAEVCWDTYAVRADFQDRYAQETFGLDERSICSVYETLSLPLPYAEPVQSHMPDWLNRFDLSGLRFAEKWRRYTADGQEPQVLRQLQAGVRAAEKARKQLGGIPVGKGRGRRQLDLLRMSADSIGAKAQLALLLHEGRRLEEGSPETPELLRWCADLPAALGAWEYAKGRHHQLSLETGFRPSMDFLNELMFEPAEHQFAVQMGERLAARIDPGNTPQQVAIAFLDNVGEPYERGLQQGQVFRRQIEQSFRFWGRGLAKLSQAQAGFLGRMHDYVSQRFPAITDELRGIAEGSGLSMEQIFWLNSFNAIGSMAVPACSTVLRKDQDGQVHLGKTSDIDAEQRRCMLLRRVRDGDSDFFVLGWFGTVWVEAALTKSGLAMGANSAPAHSDQNGYGIPQHFGLYPLLFSTEGVDAAVDQLGQIDFAGKGLVVGLADRNGNGAMVEKTGSVQAVHPMRGSGLLGVNDFLDPFMQRFNPTTPERMENCQGRRDRFEFWMATTDDQDIPLAIKELLRDNTSKGALCQTGQCGLFTEAAAILSPGAAVFQLTGQTPSIANYVCYSYNEK